MSEIIQSEIVNEIYMIQRKIMEKMLVEPNEAVKCYLRGKLEGMDSIVTLINNWNRPNHGQK